MGLFDKIKQISDQVQQGSDIILTTQVSINTDATGAKVGDIVQGTIEITSQKPLVIKSVNVKLIRRLRDATLQDRDHWTFNSKDVSAQLQVKPNETIAVPFNFVVGDEMYLNGVSLSTSKQLFGGTNPAILPKKGSTYDYEHLIVATLNIDNLPMGPMSEKRIDFDYPNSGITLTSQN